MLEICELSKSYQKRKVVDNLSFSVGNGEIFALLGSNGAGKSTTIKIILGLVKKDHGTVTYPNDVSIGYSPETPYFPPHLPGRDILRYYGRLQKFNSHKLAEEIPVLLQKVGLEDDRIKVSHYSKGMLQRLAMAQALLGDPEILILDEPCSGLDAVGRMEMIQLIRQLKRDGKTVIMNSHILSDMEKVCDRGIIISKGRLVRSFTREDLTACNLEDLFREALHLDFAKECQ